MNAMEERAARETVVDTGRALLRGGLVARTWGNISSRIDSGSFFITPSGQDYVDLTPEKIVRCDAVSGQWQGDLKPSSEKGIHAGAYAAFPNVNFVIHTHQTAATAIGLAGFDTLDITEGEREKLGGLAVADYGLPGTGKLKKAVAAAFASGAQTVLMKNHGAVVCGSDAENAMGKIVLLEEICKRSLKLIPHQCARADGEPQKNLIAAIKEQFPTAEAVFTENVLLWAEKGRRMKTQLDDVAQMLGSGIESVPCEKSKVLAELGKRDAVFVRGFGAIVKAENADDTQALKLLVDKAAVCALHTEGLGAPVALNGFDVALMRAVYKYKYSKLKG